MTSANSTFSKSIKIKFKIFVYLINKTRVLLLVETMALKLVDRKVQKELLLMTRIN